MHATRALRLAAGAGRAPSRAVFVDGTRTPFSLSQTVASDLMAVDLARTALKGLITKTALDPSKIDYVVMGTVIQEGEERGYRGAKPV